MDVFISYANANRDHAARLAGTLTRAGYEVWWDRTIPPGRVFDEVIQDAIAAARCMLVLWSRESVRSNWVATEAAEGAARGMLVPVLIDDVAPPLAFRRLQAVNLTRWEGSPNDARFRQLRDAVARLVDGAAPPGAQRLQTSHADGTDASGRTLKVVGIGAVCALGAVVALWLLLQPGVAGPSAPGRDGTEPPRAAGARVNLLATGAGGELVVASSGGWQKMVDGEVDSVGRADQGSGVFAFDDGRAATFDSFGIYVGDAAGTNVRDFELFVGDDSPTGRFRSIGRYHTQNLRVMRNPWQSFEFAPVTAKYFKFQGQHSHDGTETMFVNEIRLLGRLAGADARPD